MEKIAFLRQELSNKLLELSNQNSENLNCNFFSCKTPNKEFSLKSIKNSKNSIKYMNSKHCYS